MSSFRRTRFSFVAIMAPIMLVLLLVNCSGGGGSSSGGTAGTSGTTMTGRWEGTYILSYPTATSTISVTLFLTQSGTDLSGSWSTTGAAGQYGTFTGTANNGNVSLSIVDQFCSDSATVSGSVSNSTLTFTGSGTALADCGTPHGGYTLSGVLALKAPGSGTASYPLTLPFGLNVGAYVDSNGGKYSVLHGTQLEAVGGAPLSGYSWSVTPGTVLPYPGLIIDPLTGLVHGTPPTGFSAGTYSFSVTVSDGSTTASGPVKLIVSSCNSYINPTTDLPSLCYYPPFPLDDAGGTVTIGTTGLPTVGKAYGYSLMSGGGVPPYKNWKVISGALPPGLTLDQSRGVIYGVPLTGASGQTYQFTVSMSDSVNNVSLQPRMYRITIL